MYKMKESNYIKAVREALEQQGDNPEMIEKIISLVKIKERENQLKSIITIISIGFSIVFGFGAWYFANSANNITYESRQFEEIKFLDAKFTQSAQLASNLYDETVGSNGVLKTVYLNLWNKKDSQNEGNLREYLNKFDYLGSLYCDGFISDKHIITNFGDALSGICNNEQIIHSFTGKINNVKILCNKFSTGSFGSDADSSGCNNLDDTLRKRQNIYDKFNIPLNLK